MSIAQRFLKQSAVLERRTGTTDDWGQDIYTGPVEIPVRMQKAAGLIVNTLGVQVPNRTELMTIDEVAVGDKIDGAVVEGVAEIRGSKGEIDHYRVTL